MLQQWLY